MRNEFQEAQPLHPANKWATKDKSRFIIIDVSFFSAILPQACNNKALWKHIQVLWVVAILLQVEGNCCGWLQFYSRRKDIAEGGCINALCRRKLDMNSMKPVIPLHFISWKKTPNDAVTPICQSQFTPKMKANAVPRLLSSLVWIDQYNAWNSCYAPLSAKTVWTRSGSIA